MADVTGIMVNLRHHDESEVLRPFLGLVAEHGLTADSNEPCRKADRIIPWVLSIRVMSRPRKRHGGKDIRSHPSMAVGKSIASWLGSMVANARDAEPAGERALDFAARLIEDPVAASFQGSPSRSRRGRPTSFLSRRRARNGTSVYIALIDPADVEAQLEARDRLSAAGFEPVPHVPARFITDARRSRAAARALRRERRRAPDARAGRRRAAAARQFRRGDPAARDRLFERNGIDAASAWPAIRKAMPTSPSNMAKRRCSTRSR